MESTFWLKNARCYVTTVKNRLLEVSRNKNVTWLNTRNNKLQGNKNTPGLWALYILEAQFALNQRHSQVWSKWCKNSPDFCNLCKYDILWVAGNGINALLRIIPQVSCHRTDFYTKTNFSQGQSGPKLGSLCCSPTSQNVTRIVTAPSPRVFNRSFFPPFVPSQKMFSAYATEYNT